MEQATVFVWPRDQSCIPLHINRPRGNGASSNKAMTKPKLITAIDDIPVNFMHLGQYAFTSRNRIFEKNKDWKGENDRYSKSKKADHRDNAPQPETFKDPVVYFTVAIATDIPPEP